MGLLRSFLPRNDRIVGLDYKKNIMIGVESQKVGIPFPTNEHTVPIAGSVGGTCNNDLPRPMYTPKGSGVIAWGFNPRLSRIKRCAPEGCGIFSFVNQTSPLGAKLYLLPFLGVKTPGYDTLLLYSSNYFSLKSVITRIVFQEIRPLLRFAHWQQVASVTR